MKEEDNNNPKLTALEEARQIYEIAQQLASFKEAKKETDFHFIISDNPEDLADSQSTMVHLLMNEDDGYLRKTYGNILLNLLQTPAQIAEGLK